MELNTWRSHLLGRASGRPGDLPVSPSFDVKPDSIDDLLTHDSCMTPDLPTDDSDDTAAPNLVSEGGPARCP
jgi:hypothetical protein